MNKMKNRKCFFPRAEVIQKFIIVKIFTTIM